MTSPDRPILFSAPMIKALLASQKSQTRRLVTERSAFLGSSRWEWLDFVDPRNFVDNGGAANPFCADGTQYLHVWSADKSADETCNRVYPRIVAGDRLWVKETWQCIGYDGDKWHPRVCIARRADASSQWFSPRDSASFDPDAFDEWLARMTPRAKGLAGPNAWRPSIFMPRWASRISLLVTAVRVERVQDITEADALAEGVVPSETILQDGRVVHDLNGTARGTYAVLWDSINGKRAAWSSNPWCWVYGFVRERAGL